MLDCTLQLAAFKTARTTWLVRAVRLSDNQLEWFKVVRSSVTVLPKTFVPEDFMVSYPVPIVHVPPIARATIRAEVVNAKLCRCGGCL